MSTAETAGELAGIPPVQRCACVTRLFDQCIRRAAEPGGMCADCAAMRQTHGHRNHRIALLTKTELRQAADAPALLEGTRAHCVLIADLTGAEHARLVAAVGDILSGL